MHTVFLFLSFVATWLKPYATSAAEKPRLRRSAELHAFSSNFKMSLIGSEKCEKCDHELWLVCHQIMQKVVYYTREPLKDFCHPLNYMTCLSPFSVLHVHENFTNLKLSLRYYTRVRAANTNKNRYRQKCFQHWWAYCWSPYIIGKEKLTSASL